MQIKEIKFEKTKSYDYNNEKAGIVIELVPGEDPNAVMAFAKDFVLKQLGEKTKEFYSVMAKCDNCGAEFGMYGQEHLAIPVGEQLINQSCPNCDCITLRKP